MRIGAVVLAALLGLLGIRSAIKWSSVRFEGETLRDHFLYSLHVTARTCVWFALAGAFVGFAVLDEPERFRWYLLVPMGLAALQVLAAIGLWRSPLGTGTGSTRGSSDPGLPQPEAAEVESARVLAGQARVALREAGLSHAQIQWLANEYVALDFGDDLDDFIEWARRKPGSPAAP